MHVASLVYSPVDWLRELGFVGFPPWSSGSAGLVVCLGQSFLAVDGWFCGPSLRWLRRLRSLSVVLQIVVFSILVVATRDSYSD